MSQMGQPAPNLGEFSPRSIYDAPSVVFKQVMDGEFTFRGGLSAFLDPNGMTAAERDTLVDSLRQATGGNRLAEALGGIVTNPWVWAAAILTPGGLSILGKGGRSLFNHTQFFNDVVQRPHFHMALGLLSPVQNFDAIGGVSPIITKAPLELEQMQHAAQRYWRSSMEQFLASNNFRRGSELVADPTALEGADAARLREAFDLMHIRLNGWDSVRQVARTARGKDGKRYKKFSEVPPAFDKGAVDREIAKYPGLDSMIESMRSMLRARKVQLYGVEDEAAARALREGNFDHFRNYEFKPDTRKISRVHRALTNNELYSTKVAVTGGEETVGAQMARELIDASLLPRNTKAVTQEELTRILAESGNDLPIHYLPRNITEVVEWNNGRIISNPHAHMPKFRQNLAPAGFARDRKRFEALYYPEDAKRLGALQARLGGGAQWFDKQVLAPAFDLERKALKKGAQFQPVRVLRIDPLQSVDRYMDRSARTWFTFVADADEVAISQLRDQVKSGRWTKPVVEPPDGFTNADILQNAYINMPDTLGNRYAKDLTEQWVVPFLSGTMERDDVLMSAVAMSTKRLVGGFANSTLGQGLKGTSMKPMIEQMELIANSDYKTLSSRMGRTVSSYLYMTHMGFNLASVVLNLTQPFLLIAPRLGLASTLEAYTKAVPELFNYMGARSKQIASGKWRITDVERAELVSRHFRHADVAAIGPRLAEQLEELSLKGNQLYQPEGVVDRLTQLSLMAFSKAEMLNRSVAAHAVELAYARRGVAATQGGGFTPQFRYDAQRMIGATQFVSTPENMPIAFQGTPSNRFFGGVLSSQPLRQFMSFPLRSLTALTWDSRFMGTGSMAANTAREFARGMGISALLYEVARGTVGVDLSRALYFSASTDIVPGLSMGRLEGRDSTIPVAPVLDIPIETIKALADPNVDVVASVAPRLIPGGIALQRLMSIGPMEPTQTLSLGLQRQFTDWTQRDAEGRVPIYQSDGRLLGFEHPGLLVARALGLDINRFSSAMEVDQFLAKNAQQIREYEGKAVQALLNNEPDKARQVAADFRRRFGFDLKLSQQQIRRAQQSRTVTRTERMIDQLPPEARPTYASFVAPAVQDRLGLSDPTELTTQGTSRQRQRANPPGPMTPAAEAAYRELMREQAAQEATGSGGRQPFGTEPFSAFSP